jgi:coproporphyrinogen III oxidase
VHRDSHPRYFYIPCRKEHRGIGGLFFDDIATGEAGYDAEVRCGGALWGSQGTLPANRVAETSIPAYGWWRGSTVR